MSPLLLLVVALAGGVGAGLRWLVDVALSPRLPEGFPWAILVVNVSGSFALGLLTGLSLEEPWLAVAGAGLLGGYTTFSTVAVDAAIFWRDGRWRAALLDAIGTLVVATTAAAVGLAAGVLLF